MQLARRCRCRRHCAAATPPPPPPAPAVQAPPRTPTWGQVVVGPPGSGKTTYCAGMQQYLELSGRQVAVINLDPAADPPPQPGTLHGLPSLAVPTLSFSPRSHHLSRHAVRSACPPFHTCRRRGRPWGRRLPLHRRRRHPGLGVARGGAARAGAGAQWRPRLLPRLPGAEPGLAGGGAGAAGGGCDTRARATCVSFFCLMATTEVLCSPL